MSHKIVRVFLDVSMSCGYDGLETIAAHEKIDLKSLPNQAHVVFINKDQSKMKITSANDLVTYLRLPRGCRIDLRTISMIPLALGASRKFDYESAVRELLEGKLKAHNENK